MIDWTGLHRLLIGEGEEGGGYSSQTPLVSCQKWYIEIL